MGNNTKGTFYAKMGSIKDRNGRDLTEAEDIKKRWQEYTEELYKQDLHGPGDNNGVTTYLGPDILDSEVKWALASINTNKASMGDGIPVEMFLILSNDAVKVLHSICQQIWKTQQCPKDWKRWVFIPIPKKGFAKECSDYHTIALIAHSSEVMLKILQAWEAYWAPTDLGSSSFSVLSFCLCILFMGFSRQEYWSGLPFPSPVDYALSELSTMTSQSILGGTPRHGSLFHWVRQGCGPCDQFR